MPLIPAFNPAVTTVGKPLFPENVASLSPLQNSGNMCEPTVPLRWNITQSRPLRSCNTSATAWLSSTAYRLRMVRRSWPPAKTTSPMKPPSASSFLNPSAPMAMALDTCPCHHFLAAGLVKSMSEPMPFHQRPIYGGTVGAVKEVSQPVGFSEIGRRAGCQLVGKTLLMRFVGRAVDPRCVPENQFVTLIVHAGDHFLRVVELFRVEVVRIVIGGPRAVDQQHRSGKTEFAVAIHVFIDLPIVAMIVASLPRGEGPIGRQLLAAYESGESIENQGEAGSLEQHHTQLLAEKLDQNARRFGDVEIEGVFTGSVEPQPVAAQAHVEGYGLVGQAASFVRHVARSVLDDGVSAVEAVEALAKAEILAVVGYGERPFSGGARLRRHFRDAWRELPDLRRRCRGAPVDQETVQRDALAPTVHSGESEAYFARESGGHRRQN